MSPINYRSEIDGLRALAVLPVIFFHAGFNTFSGGFVGVDIFFVISGFLITGIILRDIDAGVFRLSDFYERRARRLLPALIVVLLLSTPLAFHLMLAPDLYAYGKGLLAVATFSSNILFWQESGYFEGSAELNPLLHTWSLAVEEQFYLLFPLGLLFIGRARREVISVLLFGLIIASFLLAQWGSERYPSASFYLLPTRGWELLAGGILAVFLDHKQMTLPLWLQEIGAVAGLVLIVSSVFLLDESVPFPGFYALPAVLGTILIIAFAGSGTFIQKFLATKLLVGAGLVSYSAYLWHQPLFAFARNALGGELPFKVVVSLVCVTFGLAYLSWRWVESPFRNKSKVNTKWLFGSSVAALLCVLLLGGWIVVNDGFSSNLSPRQQALLAFSGYDHSANYRTGECLLKTDQKEADFLESCVDKSSRTLIWGDSHAAALYAGATEIAPLHFFARESCPPILGRAFASNRYCESTNAHVLSIIESLSPQQVVLHANWLGHADSRLIDDLRHTLFRLGSESPESKIYIVGGVPYWGREGLPRKLVRQLGHFDSKTVGRFEQASLDRVREADERLKRLAEELEHVNFISALDLVCNDNDRCVSVVEGESLVPLSWDDSHLTKEGSLFLAKLMRDEGLTW